MKQHWLQQKKFKIYLTSGIYLNTQSVETKHH